MNDMDDRIDIFKNHLKDIPEGASVRRYFSWLEEALCSKDALYASDYEPIVKAEEENRKTHKPFLSVLTRTQGRRPEMLRETFLCLTGQKDQDFEVVLVGHKVDDAQEAFIEEIIQEQPAFMREKIRFFRLDHGNRTAPLNFGFAHAHGEYIAILDDDDIVMDHWVSSFHEGAKRKPGAVLHGGSLSQEWMTVETQSKVLGLRAAGAPDYVFIKDFDLFEQLRINHCPISGLAFPAYLFREQGMIFDESLTTTEDWDYLMRSVLVAGAEDIREVISIWRLWTNAESSATVHKQDEWIKNHQKILDKFREMPVLVPGDASGSLMEETMRSIQEWKWPNRLPDNEFVSLYIDCGNGFSEKDMVSGRIFSNGISFDACFAIPEDYADKQISRVRFDPGEDGIIFVRRVNIAFEYEDGRIEVRGLDGTATNGLQNEKGIFFLKSDPWIIWEDIKPSLKGVRITGEVSVDIPEDMVMSYMDHAAAVHGQQGRTGASAAFGKAGIR
jgi:hypothetical protein